MSIVLDENLWAENAIKARSLGKKPFETLYRVARYYMDEGYTKKETRSMLDKFLIQCNPTASLPKWADSIDNAMRRATKYTAVKIDSIDITVPEIEIIKSIKGIQLQRLAFTLLCVAKYNLIVNPKTNGWITTPDNEIMRMSNINTSHIRQNYMYNTLFSIGMIKLPRRVDSTSVQICFMRDGDTAMSVSDFTNLGYQYMMYCGDKNYYRCQNCGHVVKKKTAQEKGGRPPKYCPECAAKIRIRQNINSVMRLRTAK